MKLNKIEKKKIEVFVNKTIKKYLSILGMDNLRPTIFYKFDDTNESKNSEGFVVAEIEYTEEYQFFKVWFYKPFLDDFRKNDFNYCEEIIRHELSHLITLPMKKIATNRFATKDEIFKADEYAACSIERLLSKLAKK